MEVSEKSFQEKVQLISSIVLDFISDILYNYKKTRKLYFLN